MIKLLTVIGTRPEAIKMAPVINEIKKHKDTIRSMICVTAQHRELLDQVLELFNIIPDFDLNIMMNNQSPSRVASKILKGMDNIYKHNSFDWILVHGDTTTAVAASIGAFYNGIKIAHVEAGLRTYNKLHPFPEEINRRMISVLADLHFAPTERAEQNLLDEGVEEPNIFVTGNSVIDAVKWVTKVPVDISRTSLSDIPWEKQIILVTVHRRENFGLPLDNIFTALIELAIKFQDSTCLVYPVHPNPNINKYAFEKLGDISNIILLPPLDYLHFAFLMNRSKIVITDSGGLQEEAPALGKPVIVVRDVTERLEAIEAGTARLVGSNTNKIVREVSRLLDSPQEYKQMARAVNPFGDGHTSKRIVELIARRKSDKII